MKPATIVRQLRKSAKLTMEELADKSKLTRQAIHAIEAGQRRPSLDTAFAIVQAVGKSLAEFDKLT